MESFYSIKEVAEMLSISEKTIRGWILNQVHLGPDFKKLGNSRRVSAKDLARFVEGSK